MTKAKKLGIILLLLLLVCSLIAPMNVKAETYIDCNINNNSITIITDGYYHIKGNGETSNKIVIKKDVNAYIRLENVKIHCSGSPFVIEDDSRGNITIELVGNNELIGIGGPAICKNSSNDVVGHLVIDGSGSLIATNRSGNGAGIGSSYQMDTRNISIRGGTITATAGYYGAGIGGGGGGGCASNIQIMGGVVTATGGRYQGAGIGGGSDYYGEKGDAQNILISAGTVTAIAGGTGAGIGGGNGRGSNIYILGGTVSAKGAKDGNDIGGGKESQGPLVITVPIYREETIPASVNVTNNTLIFKDNTYTVSGTITMPSDLTIGEKETLFINENASFVSNGTIVNKGIIVNKGTIVNNASIVLEKGSSIVNGTTTTVISGNATLNTDGSVNRGNASIQEVIKDTNGEIIKTTVIDVDGSSKSTEIMSNGTTVEIKKDNKDNITDILITMMDASFITIKYQEDGTKVVTNFDAQGNVTIMETILEDGSIVKTEYKENGIAVVTTYDKNGNVTEKITKYANGSYVKDGYAPTIIEGEKASYQGKELVFRSDDELINFIKVTINGMELDEKYYKVESGSIRVILKDSYLSTLKKGTYTLGIVSKNGTATTSFYVTKDSVHNLQDSKQPNTGDSTNLGGWLLLFVMNGFYLGVRKRRFHC